MENEKVKIKNDPRRSPCASVIFPFAFLIFNSRQ